MQIRVKRVYESQRSGDGTRILVDRLWPRGLKRSEAKIDLWMKEIAPSTDLRKWFGHDPSRWEEFRKRYAGELDCNEEAVRKLSEAMGKGRVTLLFSARETAMNNAVALKEYLEKKAAPAGRKSEQEREEALLLR